MQFDLPMLRFEAGGDQKLGERLFWRQDGTLAYFFRTEDIQRRTAAAGFNVIELSYACVNNRVFKGKCVDPFVLQRAFVHGVFRRPSG